MTNPFIYAHVSSKLLKLVPVSLIQLMTIQGRPEYFCHPTDGWLGYQEMYLRYRQF